MMKNNLSKIMGEKRINQAELSRMTGIHKNTIQKLYNNTSKDADWNTIDLICTALKDPNVFEFIIEDSEKKTDLAA